MNRVFVVASLLYVIIIIEINVRRAAGDVLSFLIPPTISASGIKRDGGRAGIISSQQLEGTKMYE